MPKNTPEKIAELYLRLNGFFVMSHFVMLRNRNQRKHIDLVALRPAGPKEYIDGEQSSEKLLEVDENFLRRLE